ncbi:MAG: NTP transferase domain-containing protein [Candidatus Aenigmarchaeota archaeon]|nr:NTP transferase domain-containing protein [Candidatus Aenigmarchaeota archaeon]
MQVAIFCGGRGSRLYPYTENIPKPLIEIGGKPILWHVMKIFSHYGHNDFILCLGYLGEKIRQHFAGQKEGWNIEFVDTGMDTTKAGRLLKIADLISDDFFVAYGDDVSDVDVRKLYAFHKDHGKTATLTAVNPYSQYGIIEINAEMQVVDFKEKPRLDKWINGGFFVFKRAIFEHLGNGGELETQVFAELSRKRELMAYQHHGYWGSVNTFKDVLDLNGMWNSGKASWKVWK